MSRADISNGSRFSSPWSPELPPWLLVFPCCSGQSLLINHSGLYNCNPPRPPICIYLNSLKAEALFTYPQPLKAGLMLRLSKCSEDTEHSGGRPCLSPSVCPRGSTELLEKEPSLLKGSYQKEANSYRKECPFLLVFSPSCKKEKRNTNTSQPKAH